MGSWRSFALIVLGLGAAACSEGFTVAGAATSAESSASSSGAGGTASGGASASGAGGATSSGSTGGDGDGGGGGVPGGCPPGGLADLVDDFDDGDVGPQWTVQDGGFAVMETGGELSVDLDAGGVPIGDHGLRSSVGYTLPGCSIAVELNEVPNQATENEAYFKISADPVYASFFVYKGTLEQVVADNGVALLGSPAYSASEHRYLRFRENAGTIHFETSNNGTNWVAQSSFPFTLAFATVRVSLGAARQDTTPQPGKARFDDVGP